MKTSIDFLPEEKQRELRSFIELIKLKYPKKVEAVILYGSFARNTWVEDKYVEDGLLNEYKSDYDILIVTKFESKARDTNFTAQTRDMVKEYLNLKTPISLIFHGYDYVCAMLKENHYFFVDIYREGIILYNRKNRHFREPGEISYEVRIEKANAYMEEWAESADMFLKHYEFDMSLGKSDEKHYKLASFQLHQATERYFMSVIAVFTDYKPKTHDLEFLNAQVISEDSRFRHIFPNETKEEKDMFQLLKEAYIGSRYKKDFKITKEELEYLAPRVEKLKKLTYEICNEKIEQFKKLAE